MPTWTIILGLLIGVPLGAAFLVLVFRDITEP